MFSGSVDAGFVLALPFHHGDLETDCVGVLTRGGGAVGARVTKIQDCRHHVQITQVTFETLNIMLEDLSQKKKKDLETNQQQLYSLALALILTLTLMHSSTSHFEGPVH